MYPASSAVCKALMPLLDTDGLLKPILHIILEEALSALQWIPPHTHHTTETTAAATTASDSTSTTTTTTSNSPSSNKEVRVAIVVSSVDQQRQIERYFSGESSSDLVAASDPTFKQLRQRMIAMGKTLDFIIQDKPRVSSILASF